MTSTKVLGETQQGENKQGNLCENGGQGRSPGGGGMLAKI